MAYNDDKITKIAKKIVETIRDEKGDVTDIITAATRVLLCTLSTHPDKDLEMVRTILNTQRTFILNELSYEGWK